MTATQRSLQTRKKTAVVRRDEGLRVVVTAGNHGLSRASTGRIDNLLKPENKAKLRRVLTYHVVSGKVMAADVEKVQTAKALSGDTIAVKAHGGTVHVDAAQVTKADITASNGVIHVIDAVMLPKGL